MLLSFCENQGCPIHHSLVVRTEIVCILVHIVQEPPRSMVVIVCSLKITNQSLQDLAYISVHSSPIGLVLDLLIDCVHCDPISLCLPCTLVGLFDFCLTCVLYNMHADTVVISCPGALCVRSGNVHKPRHVQCAGLSAAVDTCDEVHLVGCK